MQIVLWLSLGALVGALAYPGLASRFDLGQCLGIATLGASVGGAVAYVAAGPGTVLARLLAPPSALAGSLLLLAILIRGSRTSRPARHYRRV